MLTMSRFISLPAMFFYFGGAEAEFRMWDFEVESFSVWPRGHFHLTLFLLSKDKVYKDIKAEILPKIKDKAQPQIHKKKILLIDNLDCFYASLRGNYLIYRKL